MEGGRIRRLLDLVYDVASVRDLEQFRVAVTVGIRRVVEADLASYTEIDLRSGSVIAPLDPQIDAGDAVAALGRLAHQHPLVIRTSGAAETISDYLPARRFHALELYDEVYRPLGAEDQLAISLLPPGGRVQIGIALKRPRRTFSPADRQALDLLAARPDQGLSPSARGGAPTNRLAGDARLSAADPASTGDPRAGRGGDEQ